MLDNLRREKSFLEKQLIDVQEKAKAEPPLVENLLQRAERAEKELEEKMRQCNDLLARLLLFLSNLFGNILWSIDAQYLGRISNEICIYKTKYIVGNIITFF